MALPIFSVLFLIFSAFYSNQTAALQIPHLVSKAAEISGPPVSPAVFKKAINTSPYVFTVFTQDSESNMFVYTSDDALNFSLLKGPAYVPPTGIIRDPSLIQHVE